MGRLYGISEPAAGQRETHTLHSASPSAKISEKHSLSSTGAVPIKHRGIPLALGPAGAPTTPYAPSRCGRFTLDASNDPAALFVFKIGSTLTTAPNANVILLNGAQACNVIWRVGSSATLGTGTEFTGIILALTSITATT
ncbi:Protein of unknown function (DUF3494) domain containing protein [Rhypophila sp. PSN 637]